MPIIRVGLLSVSNKAALSPVVKHLALQLVELYKPAGIKGLCIRGGHPHKNGI